MINVEKLIREGKTMDEITEMLYAESEVVNKKIAEEKEAARAAEMKKEQLKDAIKQAEAALQAVYDLSDGHLFEVIKNGKVSVHTDAKSAAGNRKSKYDLLTDDCRGTCDDIWNDLLNILR